MKKGRLSEIKPLVQRHRQANSCGLEPRKSHSRTTFLTPRVNLVLKAELSCPFPLPHVISGKFSHPDSLGVVTCPHKGEAFLVTLSCLPHPLTAGAATPALLATDPDTNPPLK